MLTIKYPAQNNTVRDWRQLLENIVVAHKMEEDRSLKEAVLEENDTKTTGEEAITKYLKQLEKEVNDWRAPGCGI